MLMSDPSREESPPGHAIETKQLSKSYGGVEALKDLTLQIPVGSVFGLIGRNGAGKTTALNLLIGLLWPDAGWARIGGYDAHREGARARRQIAFVGEGATVYPWLTVAETARYWSRLSDGWSDAAFRQCAARFDLPLDRRVGKFSKGMRTQLLLALAVGKEPQIYVLDEPTSGLDPVMRHHVLRFLQDEAAGRGRTVLLSNHVLSELSTVCTHVAVIERGRLRASSELPALLTQWRKYAFMSSDSSIETLVRDLNMPRYTKIGDAYTLVVDRDHDTTLAHLRAAPIEGLHVAAMGLEEIFLSIIGFDATEAAVTTVTEGRA